MKLIIPANYVQDNPAIVRHIQGCLATFKPLDEPGKSGGLHWLFTGCTGSGKTYLTRLVIASIYAELSALRADYARAEKCDRQAACMKFLKARDMYRITSDKIARCGFGVDAAVLDDLGKELTTEAAKQHVSNVLCERYELWQRGLIRFSIITTELGAQDLKKRYDEHVLGRIHEQFIICKFKDINHRELKKRIIK